MKKIVSVLYGLLGFSLVILVHEFGHFLACKLFAVRVPLFSIGFGPGVIGYRIGGTLFQLALFPLGGYVAIAQKQLALQPYIVKFIILIAGIVSNFLFAFCIFLFFQYKDVNVRELLAQTTGRFRGGVLGPLGIISLISFSAALGWSYFLLVLASLSIGIGMFNLLPIPFFDGGQIAWYTIEAIVGKIPDSISNSVSFLFFILLILFLVLISVKDVFRLRG